MPKNRMSLCCGAKPYKVVRWRDRHQLHARLHKMLQITLKTKNDESKASNRATCSEMYLILFIKMCVRLTNRIRYIPFLPSVRNDNIINCAMYAEGVWCAMAPSHTVAHSAAHMHMHTSHVWTTLAATLRLIVEALEAHICWERFAGGKTLIASHRLSQ